MHSDDMARLTGNARRAWNVTRNASKQVSMITPNHAMRVVCKHETAGCDPVDAVVAA